MDGAIHRISIREDNCAIQWVVIYPVDYAIRLSNSLRMADVSPRASLLGDVSRGGTSATQRQKFHTDDVKSVWNPVVSGDWTSETLYCSIAIV